MNDPDFAHESVLPNEVLELLMPIEAGIVVDATLGGAGHATAILEARPDLHLVGVDQDADALAVARQRLDRFGDRVRTVHARFDDLARVLADPAITDRPVVGVLFDLGVSSPQFDRPERGFSYRHDGPLDMRMNPRGQTTTAADLVNDLPPGELVRILRDGAGERFASRIVHRIVERRPITGTVELAELVRDAIPAATRRTGGHPATRTFQALRIAVNEELSVLEAGLDAALDAVDPGGRVLAISFHSGEDRIVKHRFRRAETADCTCPPRLPCVCGAEPDFRVLTRGGITPSETERTTNPRSSSARLRAVERLRHHEDPEDLP